MQRRLDGASGLGHGAAARKERPMPQLVHFIRHGQSTFNAAWAETGRDPGHIDAPLSPLGHDQVAQARDALAPVRVDLVITSPLTRALQTTVGIFGGRGVDVMVTCRHRERLESSCDLGRSPKELATDFPHLAFDHLADPWWHDGLPGEAGVPHEPEDVFEARVAAFAAWLDARPEASIAVVGHHVFFRSLTGRPLANCEVLTLAPPVLAAAR
jgi:broad specificity phosphatase PhoE